VAPLINVRIAVEPLENGTFVVVTRREEKPWMRHGPYKKLDDANEACRALIKIAEKYRDRYAKTYDGSRS
jgi:hypothetical protein